MASVHPLYSPLHPLHRWSVEARAASRPPCQQASLHNHPAQLTTT